MVWQSTCLITLGIISVIVGILVRLGHFKTSYWIIPFSYYRTVSYGLIPLGISIGIMGGILLFADSPLSNTAWMDFLRILTGFLFLLGLFMWLFQPKFAKPDWINWLEDNHTDILPEIRMEVFRMGPKKWARMMVTQTDLEEWVAEVRRRQAEGG